MLERSPKHREIQLNFRSLAEKILGREGGIVVESGWKNKTGKMAPATADFVIKRPPDSELTVVEAKLIRSRRMEEGLFRTAVEELKRFRDTRNAKNAALLITATPSESQIADAERHGVQLLGLGSLVSLALKTPTLAEALADMLREIAPAPGHFDAEIVQLETASPRGKLKGEGAKILDDLDKLKPGRENQKKFEQVGERAARLLLGSEVQRFTVPVMTADDGMNRPCLVARMLPQHDVWANLVADFSSRFLTFHFINGLEMAGQPDVLAAGRHLHPKAKRSIGILISRSGFDQGARRAAIELLRQEGKLVFAFGLSDLKEMLIARDAGDEYNDIFHERACDMMADAVV